MKNRVTAYGLVLGGLTGIAVGVLTNQVAVWVGIGVALGLIISAVRHPSANRQ